MYGITPWITLNGLDVAGTSFVLRHLAEATSADNELTLGPVEKAVSSAMRVMLDENFARCLRMDRDEKRKRLNRTSFKFVAEIQLHDILDTVTPLVIWKSVTVRNAYCVIVSDQFYYKKGQFWSRKVFFVTVTNLIATDVSCNQNMMHLKTLLNH